MSTEQTEKTPVLTSRHWNIFLKHGTTSLLATPVYTQNFEQMLSAIRSVKELMKQAATIKGINFEGPYINADYGAFTERNA